MACTPHVSGHSAGREQPDPRPPEKAPLRIRQLKSQPGRSLENHIREGTPARWGSIERVTLEREADLLVKGLRGHHRGSRGGSRREQHHQSFLVVKLIHTASENQLGGNTGKGTGAGIAAQAHRGRGHTQEPWDTELTMWWWQAWRKEVPRINPKPLA